MKTDLYRTDGLGNLKRQQEEVPALAPTSVQVDVFATSLNFRDIAFVRGTEYRKPAVNRVPLSDAVGVVSGVGGDVTRVRLGDRVSPTIIPLWIDGPLDIASFDGSLASAKHDGVLARTIIVDQDALVKIPDYLSDYEAATLPTAAITAWHAIVEIKAVAPGDFILIETTGGVATFALQIAVALGLNAIVTSRSDEKLASARELGAWQTINSEQDPEWNERVHEMTDGQGTKLVVDMGLRGGLVRSCHAAAFEGTVGIVGVLDGWKTTFDIAPVMNKNLRVRGVETGSRAMFERMLEFFSMKQIRPVIAAQFPFGEINEALEALRNGPRGKIVIDMST
jgi:NADPH:quinone reductase-like Zn-dependent oxidoreductase